MPDVVVDEYEIAHLDNLRRLDEAERKLIYQLAHRWRVRHDADAPQATITVFPAHLQSL